MNTYVNYLISFFAVILFTGCSKKMNHQTFNPNERLQFNTYELQEDIRVVNAPKYAFLIRTEGQDGDNFPSKMIFVNLKSDGEILHYYGLDWSERENFTVDFSTQDFSRPTGIRPLAYYSKPGMLTLWVDEHFQEGQADIVVEDNAFPETLGELQQIMDESPKLFAWDKIVYPEAVKIASVQ